MSALVLEIEGLTAGYGLSTVLSGVDLTVREGEIVAVVGPNGAGKTTFLRSLSGLVPGMRGSVRVGGRDLTGMKPHQIARIGYAHVPEGRGTLASLTVSENLWLGGGGMRSSEIAKKVDLAYDVFPVLGRLRQQNAGLLSGGEQQMLVIARGLISDPRVLAIDEPSMGLAPVIINGLLDTFRSAARTGVAILLVEQNTALAGNLADRVHVLRGGKLTEFHQRPGADLMSEFLS